MTYTEGATYRRLRQHAGRLLLVEAHRGYASVLAHVFTRAAFEVTAVSTCRAATRYLQIADFDVVISAYHLGDGTGDQLLRQARQQSSQPLTVLMSADLQAGQHARACQADAWYYKGQPRRTLMNLLSHALQARNQPPEDDESDVMDEELRHG
jgi:DNA-binding NtrC family response regulator